ncbi:hypothetical protein PFISCL1PPCAC_21727, partial [Pristionchus fissidentatus]
LQWLHAADAAPLLRSCASWWLPRAWLRVRPCAQHQQQHTLALSLCAHDVAASSCAPPAHQPTTKEWKPYSRSDAIQLQEAQVRAVPGEVLFRAISNPMYKTKMCENFELGASGLCSYAKRYEYIHPTDPEFIAYKA